MLYNFGIFPATGFIDLIMYQYGREQCTPGHSYGPAARNHYIFHYVLSGKGRFYGTDAQGESSERLIRAGEGFLLIPGQITTYIADHEDPWEYVWIEFDGLRVKEALELAGFTVNDPLYHPTSREIRDQMAEEMIYIVEHSGESIIHQIGHLWLFLDELLRSCAKGDYIPGNKMRDFYLSEAMAYIEQNFQKDISVEDIARNSGLNRSYFGRLFKEGIGQSPQRFLLSYRMIKAAELLRLTDLSVAEVGRSVSYENALHFSRAFKNYYGVSPREWRSSNHIYHKTHKEDPHVHSH